MPIIQLTETNSLDDILMRAEALNMDNAQTLDFVRGAIDVVRTTSKRVFGYTDPLNAEDNNCVSKFSRSFKHEDWIDGESVVQAEHTSLEDGFNTRFHKIENDLDALSEELTRAFSCVAEQRQEVAALLLEVKAELNRINSDIHACCDKDTPTVPFFPGPTTGYWPPYTSGQPWVSDPPRGWDIPLGGNRPGTLSPSAPWSPVSDPFDHYLDQINNGGMFRGSGAQILRSATDPSRAVVAGMQARLIEESAFNGNDVEVWSTNVGLILTPVTSTETSAQPANWSHPSLDTTARFAEWSARNTDKVRAKLGTSFTSGEFIDAFGGEKLEGGLQISTLMEKLPSDIGVKRVQDLTGALAEMAGKAVAREGLAAEAVIGSVGLNIGNTELKDTPASSFKLLPSQNSENLRKVGIKSIADLSTAKPESIVRAMKLSNVNISDVEAAGISARAATLIAVDSAARFRR